MQIALKRMISGAFLAAALIMTGIAVSPITAFAGQDTHVVIYNDNCFDAFSSKVTAGVWAVSGSPDICTDNTKAQISKRSSHSFTVETYENGSSGSPCEYYVGALFADLTVKGAGTAYVTCDTSGFLGVCHCH